ncbi:MAG TPA: Rrf2 family transcriptional regulator [Bryobacteraceae bacterium]|nr:Rrf2 family transcriptional regulator [Bryobacteraceae bacterium]
MQITRAADYAVRVMIHLAGLPPDTRASRADLAKAAECPEQFLSKVLQSLTHAGLVVSHRGNTGGFELSSAHRDASVLEIVEAVEGPVKLNLCLTGPHVCERQNWCPAHAVWAEAQAAMNGVLKKATITAMAEEAALVRTTLETAKWN